MTNKFFGKQKEIHNVTNYELGVSSSSLHYIIIVEEDG